VGEGVLVVKEAAGFNLEAANVFVLRADTKQHGVLALAVTNGDAVVEFEHGGAVTDTGNLLVNGVHILTSQVVGGTDVVGTHDNAAGVLHLDFIGAQRRDGIDRVLLASEAHCGDEHDRGGADHHAEHGKQEARLT